MGTSIEKAESSMLAVPAPHQSRAAIMRASIESESEMRGLLSGYIQKHMVEGSDFGVIPGTKKPTLLKPGAEKLIDLFRAEPSYEVTHRIEDWDKRLWHYEFRCQLKDRETGTVYAEGFGSANTREGRYRWRQGERKCPECGAETILKSKADHGGGWFCWAKKGGCGETFESNDPGIVDQVIGKVENDDVETLINTVLKMAKKRAQVDAAIALARCSDLFTQDIEDMEGHIGGGDSGARKPTGNGTTRQSEQRASAPTIPFGRSKGKRIDDPAVTLSDLQYVADATRKSVADPEKAKWRDRNQEFLTALDAEIGKRSAVGANGETSDADETPRFRAKGEHHNKPLADLSLTTLTNYETAVKKARDAASGTKRDGYEAHLAEIVEAIGNAERVAGLDNGENHAPQ